MIYRIKEFFAILLFISIFKNFIQYSTEHSITQVQMLNKYLQIRNVYLLHVKQNYILSNDVPFL